MIKKLQIKNYFQLDQIDQPLEKHNLMVGANNTGKTTFCDALFFAINGFSQLHHDFSKIKIKAEPIQLTCWLDEQLLQYKTLKLILDKRKVFLCDNQVLSYGKFLELLPVFFVSSQTLSFNKFYQQARFFYKHIVKYNPDYRRAKFMVFQQFQHWLKLKQQADTQTTALLEIEKQMTHHLYLIWEEHIKFIDEINKNIVYLCKQFFPNLPLFSIQLVSWMKKIQSKNVNNLQQMIMDFWFQKRKDDNFFSANHAPIINDLVKFNFLNRTTALLNVSWSLKQLMKLILNLAIAWFVKHQNKKICFVLDGFDFLDQQYRKQVLRILAYFDQVVLTTVNENIWSSHKETIREWNIVRFPLG